MIHDVDKTNTGTPSPNTHDVLKVTRLAHGTNSVNYTTNASSTSGLTSAKNGQSTIVASGIFDQPPLITTTNPGAGNYVAGGTTLPIYAHNIGIIPGIIGFYQLVSSPLEYDLLPSTSMATPSSSTAFWWTISLLADANTLYLRINWLVYGAATTITLAPVRWYLLLQAASA